jgi:ferredoxin
VDHHRDPGVTAVKVSIDDDRCQGHNVCNLLAPDVFCLRDDDGHAYVAEADVPTELEAVVRRAAANCPELAISVAD